MSLHDYYLHTWAATPSGRKDIMIDWRSGGRTRVDGAVAASGTDVHVCRKRGKSAGR